LNSPDGPPTGPCGPEAAPVSRSARRAKDLAKRTPATSGPSFDASSPSAVLQSSLESRLRARLEGLGSPEYALTWKHWDMPSGQPICALRASGHRTSGSVSTGAQYGWTTPQAHDATGRSPSQKVIHGTKHGCACLVLDAQTAGWPTPTTDDANNVTRDSGEFKSLARTSGWATPCTPRDNDSDYSAFRWNPNKKQDDPNTQLLGRTTPLSSVPMEKRGALNPEFVRWLMGYPAAWGSCAATATQSSRKSRRRS